MGAVTATAVRTYLGDSEAPAADVLGVVSSFVKGYTRGQGFATDGTPAADLQAVITTAAARELAIRDRHGILREEIGAYSVLISPRASDFTARELVIMNAYRRRAA